MRTLRDVNAEEWDFRLKTVEGRYKLAHRYHIALSCIADARPDQWLDIGAGNGFLASEVKKRFPGVLVTGVDFVDEALAAADALDAKIVHDLNTGSLPLEDNSQDYITCLEVLEHVVFPGEVLKEIHRLLKPGGRALVSVPNMQFVEYVLALARGKVPHPAADERHMSIFTLNFLTKLATKAQLNSRRSFGTDSSPTVFAKISPRLLAKTILLEVEKAG
jgi:2-polyprenyl-3-methyl-5-hydroxy-6-metoxy-1,4-benzoquinol methylase